jgi:hypothetical protein
MPKSAHSTPTVHCKVWIRTVVTKEASQR